MTGVDNETLRRLLGRLQWGPERFARQLNALARDLGRNDSVDIKTPYKWLHGGTPRPPWTTLCAILLSRELDEQITPEMLGWPSEGSVSFIPSGSALLAPWTADGTIDIANKISEVSSVDRRTFLLITGSALTSSAHEWLIARPVLDVSKHNGRVVTPAVVDHLEDMTSQLRRMDDQMGGGALVNLVRAQIKYVTNALRDCSYPDSIGRRLHGSVAELLRLGGWISFDGGMHADAQRFFVAALHGAHTAGDNALGANVLGFMSCQAKDLGQYSDAAKLADSAIAGYKGASPKVSAILHMRAAQAYANCGEVAECRRAIDAAYESLRNLAPESGEPDWCYWLDEAQINEQIGYCYLRLQDWSRARSHMRTALRLQEATYNREGALRLAFLADTYAQQGEPEQACEIGSRAIDALAHRVDSARCIGHVERLQEHLTPYRRTPAVREFNSKVANLVSTH